jgi:hypothetical protein
MCQEIEAQVRVRGLTRVWKAVVKQYETGHERSAQGPYFPTQFNQDGWAIFVQPIFTPVALHSHTVNAYTIKDYRLDKANTSLMSRQGYHVFLTREACERWAQCHGGRATQAWIKPGQAFIYNNTMYKRGVGYVDGLGLLVDSYTLDMPTNEEDRENAELNNRHLRDAIKASYKEVNNVRARDRAVSTAFSQY